MFKFLSAVINDADEAGISAIVDQQFGYASQILAAGLVPVIEPEVSISSPHKEQAETLLRDAITKHVEALPEGATVMLKITIPVRPGLSCRGPKLGSATRCPVVTVDSPVISDSAQRTVDQTA